MLADASSLEVLDMSSNPALELSLHDVHAVLSRMPRLSLLLLGKQAALDLPPGVGITAAGMPGGLEWRTPSVAALVALGQALPHLQVRLDGQCLQVLRNLAEAACGAWLTGQQGVGLTRCMLLHAALPADRL